MEFLETEKKIRMRLDGKLYYDQGTKTGRNAWDCGEFYIKVDRLHTCPARVNRQTAHEIELWESFSAEDKPFFAEVITYGRTPMGRYWLKQKKYEPDLEEDLKQRTMYKLEDLIFKHKIMDIFYSYHYNWFQVGGKLVIYDWGV